MSQPAEIGPATDIGTPTPRLGDLAGGKPATLRDAQAAKKSRSLWGNAWRQFRRHRLAIAGLFVLIFMLVVTFIGNNFYPHEIDTIDFSMESQSPTWNHPFGTDSLGQDILARILWGGRISIAVGILAALVSITLGTLLGAVAGFMGGFLDSLLMRITDMFISLPQLPLLLLISFLYRDRVYQLFDEQFDGAALNRVTGILDIEGGNLGIFLLIVFVIAILNWMPTARLVRAEFLSLKEKEFVEAATSIGARKHTLMFRHILPNVMSPIIVAATLAVGAAIITESSLSFLGLGFPSDVPTWGRMLFDYAPYLQVAPYQSLFPGMVIFLTVLAINYVGDGLRDALDPRKSR
jgi:peptide/nickel transport system permease protein